MYHHTLLLTFAPCLILRAKLRQETATPNEYALDAARRLVGYLARACEQNILCRVRPTMLTTPNPVSD